MADIKLLILIVMIVILAGVLIYSIIIVSKKKQYYAKIDELDYLKHEISNQTVPFELAKLRSTKKSERIVKLVHHWELRWGNLESDFVKATEQIIYIEDLVANRSFKEADDELIQLEKDLESLKEEVEQLLEEIKSLKKSEERNRSNVDELKITFEGLKRKYELIEFKGYDYKKELQVLFKDVEVFFLKFNECMDDCNYDAADETVELIKSHLDIINRLFERVPLYFETVEKELKPLLHEVLKSYESIIENGVYLKHLEIKETISYYYKMLDELPDSIKCFNFDKIETLLMDIHENAKQMLEFMKKEYELKAVIQSSFSKVEQMIDHVVEFSDTLNQRYNNIKENYSFSSEQEDEFYHLLHEIQIKANEYAYLKSKKEENQTPNSALMREINQIDQQLAPYLTKLEFFDVEIENLYAGEKECRERALQLLKLFNSIQGAYRRYNFPIENKEILDKINQANFSIQLLFEKIGQLPINLAEIDKQLQIAEMAVEDLTKQIETELTQAQLAEKLMVYAHRYVERGGMYIVDLTIAEDQFRQGNYANVIENMQQLLKQVEGYHFDRIFEGLSQQVNEY